MNRVRLGKKSDRRSTIVAATRGFLDERVAPGYHVMAAACDYRFQANNCLFTDDIRELTDLTNECRVTIFSLKGGMTVGFAPKAVRQDRRHLVSATGRIPLGPLTTVPVGGDHVHGGPEITFLLEDEDGHSTPIQKAAVPLGLPAKRLRRRDLPTSRTTSGSWCGHASINVRP
jgi:hypothetical protein